MLYEFFITPDVFDKSNSDKGSIILLQLLRNMQKNGLLANPNKGKWVPHVEKKIEKLKPDLRDKVLTCFKNLKDRHRFIRHPRRRGGDPVTDQDWLDLGLSSHEQIPFHAIILSQKLIDNSVSQCDAFVEFFDALESEKWNNREDTLDLPRSPGKYRSALAPILRYARSVALIDPHLDPRIPRFYNTIKICSNLLGNRKHDRLHGRIDIHLAEKQEDGFFDTCERKLKPLIDNDGHCFRIFIWKKPKWEWHNRYILTDQCGINVSWGLDCPNQPNGKDDWSLLSHKRRIELLGEFCPKVNRSDFVGEKKFPENCARKIHKNEQFSAGNSFDNQIDAS